MAMQESFNAMMKRFLLKINNVIMIAIIVSIESEDMLEAGKF